MPTKLVKNGYNKLPKNIYRNFTLKKKLVFNNNKKSVKNLMEKNVTKSEKFIIFEMDNNNNSIIMTLVINTETPNCLL